MKAMISRFNLNPYDYAIDYDSYNASNKLKSYYIGSWYCTDSYVGYKVYFLHDLLHDEPVAVSSQIGRKMDEEFEWVSAEAYHRVKKYVMSFTKHEDDVALADLDEEIGESYKIDFNSQLFEYHFDIPLYQGKKVKIIEREKLGKYFNIEQRVLIKFEDGDDKWVNVRELDFPYNLKHDKHEKHAAG